MKEINNLTLEFLTDSYIDAIDIAVIDFKNNKIESKLYSESDEPVFFDLASVSKPLTNGIGYLAHRDKITEEMSRVLNHRGGLPAWGLLSADNWKETILSYKIKKSDTLYSDYSALRFMLEFNKLGLNLHEEASKYWDEDLFFWKDLKPSHRTVQNGYVDKKPNYKSIHDPNAFVINDLVSHAGLFGTASSVAKTLLKLDSELDLLKLMEEDLDKDDSRFINGWDRVQDLNNTFAGKGCSTRTFWHLWFTGTSIWIDVEKKIGHILLSNATKFYWYDKNEFNIFRKNIGQLVWEKFKN
jgi:CubicO group peptidase (beta-lactamase class C family)